MQSLTFFVYSMISLGKEKNKEVLSLEMKYCKPYPTTVQVPESGNWGQFFLPSFVELHRCAGGCSISPRKWTVISNSKPEHLSSLPLNAQFDATVFSGNLKQQTAIEVMWPNAAARLGVLNGGFLLQEVDFQASDLHERFLSWISVYTAYQYKNYATQSFWYNFRWNF